MHKLRMKLLGHFSPPKKSKMEFYVAIFNNFYSLTDVTKNSILDAEGYLRSAIIHIIIAILVTELHLKFI